MSKPKRLYLVLFDAGAHGVGIHSRHWWRKDALRELHRAEAKAEAKGEETMYDLDFVTIPERKARA